METTTVRISKDLQQLLDVIAKKNERSATQEVAFVLKRHVVENRALLGSAHGDLYARVIGEEQ
jgi:predicted transcriptional regulator